MASYQNHGNLACYRVIQSRARTAIGDVRDKGTAQVFVQLHLQVANAASA